MKIIVLIFLLLITLTFGCKDAPMLEVSADIAIYSDKGVWEESLIASENMFQWMGYTTIRLNAEYINRYRMKNIKLVCIPGGDMYTYSQSLNDQGKRNIRAIISEGGGYIGICAGAYFAAERVIWNGTVLPMTPLSIFSGESRGPINEISTYPNYDMCKINIFDTLNIITHTVGDTSWMLYYWGPAFFPYKTTDVSILGKYSITDQTAILAFTSGNGKVFLTGTHPEIEEDSDRDSVTFAYELEDKGSDWDLMKNAVRWCLRQ